jgi:hypothetical protein
MSYQDFVFPVHHEAFSPPGRFHLPYCATNHPWKNYFFPSEDPSAMYSDPDREAMN